MRELNSRLAAAGDVAESLATDQRTKVLHVVSSGGLYGIERHLLSLLPALHESGLAVALLCLEHRESEGGAVGRAMEKKAVQVFYIPMRRRLHPADLVSIGGLLRRTRPAVVHVHGYKASAAMWLTSLMASHQLVATAHSERAANPELEWLLRMESFLFRRFKGLIAVSSAVARDLRLRGVNARRVVVITNGVPDVGSEIEQRPVDSRRNIRLVVVGRLVEPKNVHITIEATALMIRRGYTLDLEILGDGPERQRLEALARAHGISTHVQFNGYVENVRQRTAGSLFLMPSRSEGIPIALLEAMSLGLPIVASKVGGIPEVLEHEKEAILIPPDDVGALTIALERLIKDVPFRLRLGNAARTRFLRDFHSDKTRDAHLSFYRSLV